MCGICGFVRSGPQRSAVERHLGLPAYIKRMTAIQRHRGPDNEGSIVEEKEGFAVALGHNRLSILDLSSKANQPMCNEDRSLWVTFNGEIYNYLTLRRQLVEKGHRFVSSSDTEVLVHGYEEWGTDLFGRLDGIFAFAFWDGRRKALILGRDYFGVKPLHYTLNGNTLRFSSEIKAMLVDDHLKRVVNEQAIHNIINLRYNVSTETLFKEIFRLEPGFFAVYQNGRFHRQRYAAPLPESRRITDPYEVHEEIRNRMINAVEKQLMSDVPVGISLSGGIDSSSLVGIRGKILDEKHFHTFTLGFSSERDEIAEANRFAQELNTNHHSLLTSSDILSRLPLAIWHLEEPKVNAIQNLVLSEFISKYVKVVFSGLGGDELFAGYNFHKFIRWGHGLGSLLPPAISDRFSGILRGELFQIQQKVDCLWLDEPRRGLQMLLSTEDPTAFYLIPRNVWDFDEGMWTQIYHPAFLKNRPKPVHSFFRRFFRGCSTPDLDKTLRAEFWTKMIDDLLLNEDRMSMAKGIESRVPLLDKDLVHLAFSLPPSIKMQRGSTKGALKGAMKDILPSQVLGRPKTGFQLSSYELFRYGLRDLANRTLTEDCIESRGIFNYRYIRQILDCKPSRLLRWHYFFLLLLVGLEYWFRIFVDQSINISSSDHSHYTQ